MVVIPFGYASVSSSESLRKAMKPTIGQLSDVIGDGNVTNASQFAFASTIVSFGQVIIGLMVSITITINEHVSVFIPQSVMVYITRVIPIMKGASIAAPSLLVVVIVSSGQLSFTVGGGNITIAVHSPGLVNASISAGQVIVGSS